jgi:hypothetical protein
MRQRLKAIFKGPVVFYPLLFAAFPILFLYSYNLNETSASQMWLPLGVSVAATLVLWAVLSLILRSLAKAGLATAIFLVFFFSYGRFYDGLNYLGVFVKHAYLFPAMLFVWGYCVYFISRAKRDFRITTKLFNIVAVVLIAINLVNIASYEIKLARLNTETPAESPQETAANATELSTLPDIYFILFDEYARSDVMKDWYDYDSSWFVEDLEDKGFFVASQTEIQTMDSPRLVAERLNMEYIDDAPWSDSTYRKLAYNKVADLLKAQGYKYIVFGNSGDVGRWDGYAEDNADFYFNYYIESATPWVSEFQEILWNTTMLRPFYYQLVGGQSDTVYQRMTLYTLEHLKAIPEEVEGPKFIFAFLCCPHAHFVFDAEGGHVDPLNWQNFADKQFYRDQYIFISKQIEEVVDALLEKSETPPIIILQSDHGMRPHHPGIVIGPDEWRKILNAMYLPGVDYSELSDSIPPVNTFRLVFDYYFGADYPLLDYFEEQ